MFGHGIIDRLAVIGAVRRHRRNFSIDLLKQSWYF
jgi:hypothetical protein